MYNNNNNKKNFDIIIIRIRNFDIIIIRIRNFDTRKIRRDSSPFDKLSINFLIFDQRVISILEVTKLDIMRRRISRIFSVLGRRMKKGSKELEQIPISLTNCVIFYRAMSTLEITKNLSFLIE